MRGRLNPSVTSQESPRHDEQILTRSLVRDRSSFSVFFAPRGLLVVSTFAVLLAAVHGRSHLGSYGSACELKGAGACGDDEGEERGCAKTLTNERKETVVIRPVLGTRVRAAWSCAANKVFCV